jgi:iron(III) transport system permease protein
MYLAIVVAGDPARAVEAALRPRTLELAARSLALAASVSVTATVIGVALAWLTARSNLPMRGAIAILVVLPFAVPSYIGAYLVVSALGPGGLVGGTDWVYGFGGAWLVLSLFTYPLVLLPVRAALSRLDPAIEEAAQGFGRRPWAVFTSVVLPQIRPAIVAGSLLVALYVLADFGAVSILRFDSFTRAIYQSYRASFDRTGAAALACVLVLIMIVLVLIERRVRGRGYGHPRIGTPRPAATVPLGAWRVPALLFCGLVIMLSLVLPVATLLTWSARSLASNPDWERIGLAAGGSLSTAGIAALVAVIVAAPIAYLVARHQSRLSRIVETIAISGYALPGLVIALALVFVGTRLFPWLYQTLPLLILALVVHYLPLALGAMRTSLQQLPLSLEEAARSTGRGPLRVWFGITMPLTLAGTLAGLGLVFLAAIKELPAVLLLAPTEFDTLASLLWQQTNASVFEAGAIPALLLLAVSAPPLYLLLGRQ